MNYSDIVETENGFHFTNLNTQVVYGPYISKEIAEAALKELLS